MPEVEQGPSSSPDPPLDRPASPSPEERAEPSTTPSTPPETQENAPVPPAPEKPAAAEKPTAPQPAAPAEAPAGDTVPPPQPAQTGKAPEGPKLAGKGEIVEATVRRIAPFGAFVRLADGRKGLIHISQVAEEYVEDVKTHLTIGQVVQARITAVADDGKVDLSIKKAKARPKPQRPPRPRRRKPSERDDAKPPKRAEQFHVNPLADVLGEVEKKLK